MRATQQGVNLLWRKEKVGRVGATPPPPPPKRRQAITEGGDAPPTVKVKGGEAPLEAAGSVPAKTAVQESQARQASSVLEAAGYPEFPEHVPNCGGSIADINQGRLDGGGYKEAY